MNGYIRNLITKGNIPTIIKLHQNLDEETSYRYEESLISFYGRKGIDEFGILLNILDSGRPPSFSGESHPWFGRKHTEESKQKIKNNLKEYYKTHEHPWTGKKHTEETKRKISEKKTGKKMSPESIQKRVDSVKGFKQSEYQKQKVKLANSCWWKVIDRDGKEYITQELKKLSEELGYSKSKLSNIFYENVNSNGIIVIKLTEKGESYFLDK